MKKIKVFVKPDFAPMFFECETIDEAVSQYQFEYKRYFNDKVNYNDIIGVELQSFPLSLPVKPIVIHSKLVNPLSRLDNMFNQKEKRQFDLITKLNSSKE